MIEERRQRAHINNQRGNGPEGQRRVRKRRTKLVERTMVSSPAINCAIADARMGTGGDDASTRPVGQALPDVRRDKLTFPENSLLRANDDDNRENTTATNARLLKYTRLETIPSKAMVVPRVLGSSTLTQKLFLRMIVSIPVD